MQENILADEYIGRRYDEQIPEFLRNRPKSFVKHCLNEMSITGNRSVDDEGCKTYTVKDEVDETAKVSLKGEEGCTCLDLMTLRLLCLHKVFVMFRHEKMPEAVMNSPYASLDALLNTKIASAHQEVCTPPPQAERSASMARKE